MKKEFQNFGLAIGYLCLLGAAVVAHQSPATQYEISIYTSTPISVWVLLGAAYFVAIVVSVTAERWQRTLALGLGTAATTLFVALPLVRDYRYVGGGDALTHLGWGKAIAEGTLSPFELLYPSIHAASIEFSRVTGGSLERSFLLVVVFFSLAYLISVPLIVRRITDNSWGTVFGAVSAWLLLPINNISAHMMPFPTIQAIFLVPFALFALLLALDGIGNERALPGGISPGSLLLVLFGTTILFTHPQQLVNVVVVLVAASFVQFVARWFDIDHAIAHQHNVLSSAIVLTLLLAVWGPIHPRVRSSVIGAGNSINGIFGGGGSGSGSASTVAQRGGSLETLGAGLLEIAMKLFSVSIVYVLLCVVAILSVWLYRSTDQRAESVTAHFSIAAIPLVVLFGVYFLATPSMAFRQLAFGMVIATILGAIELSRLADGFEHRFTRAKLVPVVTVVMAVFLVLSAVTLFPSPFILKSTSHVTDQQFAGYEATSTYRADDYAMYGIRAGPERLEHGVNGLSDPVELDPAFESAGVPEGAFRNGTLPSSVPHTGYFIVTESSYAQEVVLYDGFRYPKEGFERLSNDPSVDMVLSNGDVRLYRIESPNGTVNHDGATDVTTTNNIRTVDDITETDHTTDQVLSDPPATRLGGLWSAVATFHFGTAFEVVAP
ncbi:hypothetical protein [Haloarchaeobius sp. DFWS5]|uniref:hypothetical protein n=1 Tax=Haloarchaeobius sp. DFWS5 TaxID=3446114 RepID=UPI003EC139CA